MAVATASKAPPAAASGDERSGAAAADAAASSSGRGAATARASIVYRQVRQGAAHAASNQLVLSRQQWLRCAAAAEVALRHAARASRAAGLPHATLTQSPTLPPPPTHTHYTLRLHSTKMSTTCPL